MSEPIVAVLEHYGADVPTGYGWLRTRCPFHEDANPSASVNLELGRFACFTCDINEDAEGLVMKREGVGYAAAQRRVQELAGSGGDDLRGEPGPGGYVSRRPGDRPGGRSKSPAWRRVGA